MKRNYYIIWTVFLAISIAVFSGCAPETGDPEPVWLIRAGDICITALDFNRAFEVHKTAYDYDDLGNPAVLKKARVQFLQQTAGRLPVTARAAVLHITVSDAEMETEIRKIRQGYPDGEFEKALLESAVSPALWQESLRDRLLVDKVIAHDLGRNLKVSPEEIEVYRKDYEKRRQEAKDAERKEKKKKKKDASPPEPVRTTWPDLSDDDIRSRLLHDKTEAACPDWLKHLRKQYPVQVNPSEWEKLINA